MLTTTQLNREDEAVAFSFLYPLPLFLEKLVSSTNDILVIRWHHDHKSIYSWINTIVIEVGHCNYIQFSMRGLCYLERFKGPHDCQLEIHKYKCTMQIHNTLAPSNHITIQRAGKFHMLYQCLLFFHTVMTSGLQMRYLKESNRCRKYANSENKSRWHN